MAVLVKGAELAELHWPRAVTLASGLSLAVAPLYADDLGQTVTTAIIIAGVVLGFVAVVVEGRRTQRLRRENRRVQADLRAARSDEGS